MSSHICETALERADEIQHVAGLLVLTTVTQGANVTALRIGDVPMAAPQAPERCLDSHSVTCLSCACNRQCNSQEQAFQLLPGRE